MGAFLRWAGRALGRIDASLARIENHEALVESSLRAAAERLRAFDSVLARALEDRAQIASALVREREVAAATRERARVDPDELSALSALRRSRRALCRARELEHQLGRLDDSLERLHGDRDRLLGERAALDLARRDLAQRQDHALSLGELAVHPVGASDAHAALERWESQVTTAEAVLEIRREVTLLDESLEDDRDVLAELRELRRSP